MLNQHEHLNNLENGGKDIMPNTTQAPKHTRTDHLGEINKAPIDKRTGESSTCKHILGKPSSQQDQDGSSRIWIDFGIFRIQ